MPLSLPASPRPRRRLVPVVCMLLSIALTACSASYWRASADQQVYGILEQAAEKVTGEKRPFKVERPVDRLRDTLLKNPAMPVKLTLQQALDVAAENSREFQRQKEQLYQAALSLTREQFNFETRFSGGSSTTVDGTDEGATDLSFRNDLSSQLNTTTGGRLVAGFVNNFMRSVLTASNGRIWDSSSLLSLSFTQPLWRGGGARIAREPLTQAERSVVYAMRTFERFRNTFAVRVVSDYYSILSQMDNLVNSQNNYQALIRDRIRQEALVKEDRQTSVQLDQAKQSELVAQNRVVVSEAGLQSTLDRFKLTLGLPTDANLELDKSELKNLRALEKEAKSKLPAEQELTKVALSRRFDYQTSVDQVTDSVRRVLVSKDALNSFFDFDAALSVPTEPDEPFSIDFEKIDWSVGFDLDLALQRLPERNSYRTSIINLDVAIRSREQLEDNIKQQIRQDVRDLNATGQTYEIQTNAVRLAERRVRQTEAFLAASRGNTTIRDVLEAKDALLSAQISQTRALVDLAVSRLSLLSDMESLVLESQGLRFDQALPMPDPATIPKPHVPVTDGEKAIRRFEGEQK